MELTFDYIEGQTPLDEEEKEGLLISTITTRSELDEFEQLNIEQAMAWTLNRRFSAKKILSEDFIKELHLQMFGRVWTWAGHFRHNNKNLGVKWQDISVELKKLLDDINFWQEKNTYTNDEAAIRFKHRLVSIHCFANGNGRHSRLMADVIAKNIFALPEFTWNGGNLAQGGDARKNYLHAIREADRGNMTPLIDFARGGNE